MLPKEINALRYFLPLVRLPLFRLFPFVPLRGKKKSPKGSFFLLFAYVSFASGKNKGRKKLPFGDEKKTKEEKKSSFPLWGNRKEKKRKPSFCPQKNSSSYFAPSGLFLKKNFVFLKKKISLLFFFFF